MGLGAMTVKRNAKQYLSSVNRHALNLTARTTKALTKHVQKRFVTKHSSAGYAVAVHENTTLGLLTMWFPLTPKACYLPHRFLIHGNDGTVGPGRRLWNDIWSSGAGWLKYETDGEMAMMVCEQTDERAVLRLRLLNGGDWRDRAQLRQLEKLIASNLSLLGFTPTDRARLGGNTAPIDELNIFRQKVNAKRATA